jgi:hypothetical protein
MPILWFLIMPISVSQNMPSEYVYIRACKHASLFKPTSVSKMTFSIHPYLDLKRHPSVYGPVRVSNNSSVYLTIMLQKCPCVYHQIFVYEPKRVFEDAFLFMPIFGFPRTTSSICLYFDPKNAPQCTPM